MEEEEVVVVVLEVVVVEVAGEVAGEVVVGEVRLEYHECTGLVPSSRGASLYVASTRPYL